MLKYTILFVLLAFISSEVHPFNNIAYYTSFKIDRVFQAKKGFEIYLRDASRFSYKDGHFEFYIEYMTSSKDINEPTSGEFKAIVNYL
jgi:hypothetical protein